MTLPGAFVLAWIAIAIIGELALLRTALKGPGCTCGDPHCGGACLDDIDWENAA